MTDEDYVAELRSYGMLSTNQAADRIEQLTAERDRLRALPAVQPDAEAARLLDDIVCGRGMFGVDPAQDLQWAMETAAAALALIDKPSHVSETPKSEHDAANVLTPATKGGDA